MFFITKNIYYFIICWFILIGQFYLLSALGLKYRFQAPQEPRLRKEEGRLQLLLSACFDFYKVTRVIEGD